ENADCQRRSGPVIFAEHEAYRSLVAGVLITDLNAAALAHFERSRAGRGKPQLISATQVGFCRCAQADDAVARGGIHDAHSDLALRSVAPAAPDRALSLTLDDADLKVTGALLGRRRPQQGANELATARLIERFDASTVVLGLELLE